MSFEGGWIHNEEPSIEVIEFSLRKGEFVRSIALKSIFQGGIYVFQNLLKILRNTPEAILVVKL